MSKVSSHIDTEAAASVLARRMKHIREPQIRKVKLGDYLNQHAAGDVIRTLAELIQQVSMGADIGYTIALDALTGALGDAVLVPYKTRAELYVAAKDAGHMEIARLFFDASPAAESVASRDDAMAPERPLRPRGRPLTLGERKSLARSHRRELLLSLLRDPHPDVVRILLGNPHLTEPDVLRIASRRPSAPEALAILARNTRWSVRYAVKCALVFNPHTPVPLVLRLLTTVRPADLRSVVRDGNLPQSVREQAQALLDTRPS